jgi:hypothetical protein
MAHRPSNFTLKRLKRCRSSQRAVSRKERLRLLLLSAVSRNQAALASDQNERQRFLLTGESDNNRRREAGVMAGGQKACRTPGWQCR